MEKELEVFVKESFPVNVNFAERLGVEKPVEILINFEILKNFIFGIVEEFTKELIIENDNDINWILSRLGYLMGEYFNQKYNGFWDINKNQNSKQYKRYVLFLESETGKVYPVDIFEALMDFLNTKPIRSLKKLIQEIENEIK